MKPLPDRGNPFRQAVTFKSPHFSCLTGCRHSRNLMAMLLLWLLTAFIPINAQPAIQWDKTFGGDIWDYLSSLQQTSDGGYILGGYSYSGISGDKTEASKRFSDYWVVKLDAAGNQQWDKTIGGSDWDNLTSLQQTADGGYILGGDSDSGISGDKTGASKGFRDYWVVRLDAAGNKVWDKTIGGENHDERPSLQQTLDGGYILGGSSWSSISGDKTEASRGRTDYWVVKLDAAGNRVWDKTLGGEDYDKLFSLQQTSDGGYILGGYSASGISGDKTQTNRGVCSAPFFCYVDYWVVKLDAAGNKVWDKTIGGSSDDILYALQQTVDGGYILGGYSKSPINGDKTSSNQSNCNASFCNADYWVVKLDAAGNKVWDKVIGGSSDDILYALQQTADGGYFLGGESVSPISGQKTEASKGSRDYWVVKLDAAGNKVWDKTIGGSSDDILSALQQTADGGYILGGESLSLISGDKTEASRGHRDYWVVKLAPLPEGPQVKSFTLINTESEQPIRLLNDGDTLDLAELPKKLNIRADTHPDSVGSVVFALSGPQIRLQVDNERPYALFGDVRGDYEKWYPAPGSYTLTAIPYSGPDGQGTEGTPLTIRFTVKPPQVKSFTLINTESEQPIRALQDGDTLNLAELPKKLNIRADTDSETVGSVLFALSGQQTRNYRDNAAPYALFGDVKGDYNKWYPAPGSYTLTATPYTERDAKGYAGTPLTIRFTVVRQPAATLAARIEQAEATPADLVSRLTLYPNPTTNGYLKVQLPGEMQGRVSYRLLSAAGSKLGEGTINLAQAGTLLELDFSRQLRTPALYYLKLEGANMHQVFKIIRR